jgi:Antitoxin VbhA
LVASNAARHVQLFGKFNFRERAQLQMEQDRHSISVARAGTSVGLTTTASATRPVLSAEERRKREDAVRFANASVGLEGFRVTPEAEARAQRFVSGEIDLAQFLQDE